MHRFGADLVGPFLVRASIGLGLALVVHLILRPFVGKEVRDDVAMTAFFAVIVFRSDAHGSMISRSQSSARIAAAIVCGGVVALVWWGLGHLPASI